jgi:uncharacterized damage-inducible protein DinB
MNDLVINRRNFDVAKNKIKEFSEKISENVSLKTFKTEGILFGDHHVTGAELNDLTLDIQKQLMNSNNSQIELFKEFNQVYLALEALDKDYIRHIITAIDGSQNAIKSAEKAIESVETTIKHVEGVSRQAKSAADKAEANSIDIKKTIEVLKRFQLDIENLKQLKNVDQLWDDSQKLLSGVGELKQFQVKLEALTHLMDVDQIWSDSRTFLSDIDKLKQYRIRLETLAHLMDVDQIWNDGQKLLGGVGELKQFQVKLEALTHLMDVDQIWSDSRTFAVDIRIAKDNINELGKKINKLSEDAASTIEILTRKLKLSYVIAGGAMIVSVAGVLFNFFGAK